MVRSLILEKPAPIDDRRPAVPNDNVDSIRNLNSSNLLSLTKFLTSNKVSEYYGNCKKKCHFENLAKFYTKINKYLFSMYKIIFLLSH